MNRWIAYGYSYENGEKIRHPEEYRVVQQIFSDYLLMCSMQKVGRSLEARGIAYKEGQSIWSKALVKRILQNRKYIGEDGYPQVIPLSVFEEVQGLIERNRNNQTLSPILPLKPLLFCESCGMLLKRNHSKISCEKHGSIQEQLLIKMLMTKLRSIRLNPKLIDPPAAPVYATCEEIRETADAKDVVQIKELLFRQASLRFEQCQQWDKSAITEKIRDRINREEPNISMILDIAKRILVGSSEIQMELLNDVII